MIAVAVSLRVAVAVRARFGEAPGRVQALAARISTGVRDRGRDPSLMLHHRFLRPLNAWILATIMARVAMRVLTCLALASGFAPPAPVAVRQQTKQLMKKPSPVASGVR